MKLLPEKLVIKRNIDDDCSGLYYKPFIGYFYRKRLEMTECFLKNHKFNKLLEIGYGSGIFLPELKKHCQNLFGVDLH